MAHILVFVLVPPSEPIDGLLQKLMEPYNEYKTVQPYKIYITDDGVAHEANISAPILYSNRQETEQMLERDLGKGEFSEDEYGFYYETDENPEGQWDYWLIGGRWDGIFAPHHFPAETLDVPRMPEQSSPIYHVTSVYRELLEGNICRVSDIIGDTDRLPFALVTPEGQWEDKGWTDIFSEQNSRSWFDYTQERLRQYNDHFVIALDAHC
jgi:hypothetical protein